MVPEIRLISFYAGPLFCDVMRKWMLIFMISLVQVVNAHLLIIAGLGTSE
jgi:hypothetical protein